MACFAFPRVCRCDNPIVVAGEMSTKAVRKLNVRLYLNFFPDGLISIARRVWQITNNKTIRHCITICETEIPFFSADYKQLFVVVVQEQP